MKMYYRGWKRDLAWEFLCFSFLLLLLTDIVCSFQARISRFQLDLLQGESDNHVLFHSPKLFHMDFFEVSVYVLYYLSFLFTFLYESGVLGGCLLTLYGVFREIFPRTTASASLTLDWSSNISWAEHIGVTTPGRDSELCTTTSLDPRGWVNHSHSCISTDVWEFFKLNYSKPV